jgi:Domain of unknown function (DUF4926)
VRGFGAAGGAERFGLGHSRRLRAHLVHETRARQAAGPALGPHIDRRRNLAVAVPAPGLKKCDLDCAVRAKRAEICDLLGAVMDAKESATKEGPSVLDVVALLTDHPAEGLARGQVGTVVEQLDDRAFLVEFSDDQGRAYAVVRCSQAELLVLHYVPEAA